MILMSIVALESECITSKDDNQISGKKHARLRK